MTQRSIEKQLAQLTDAIERLVAVPPIPAIPAIPSISPIPAIPAIPALIPDHSDHDLLLRIDTKVERVITDVAKLNDNYSGRIDSLERGKVSQIDCDKCELDHENRIRNIEKWCDNLTGKLTAITASISIVVAVVVSWISKKLGI